MKKTLRTLGHALLAALVLQIGAFQLNAQGFSLADIKAHPFPNGLTAASSGSRIAWAVNDRGKRNIFVAEGPTWAPRQLTSYHTDDGQELTSLTLSADGKYVVYVRGGDHGSNFDDALPVFADGATTPVQVQIWTVPFEGGAPRALGDGENPIISPAGDLVAFEKDRQIWVAQLNGAAPPRRLFTARGTNGGAQWSPDGSKVAFVSSRGDHSFIGVYSGSDAPIRWMEPSTSRDASPRWSPDGTRLAFVRRPGAGGSPQPVLEQRPQAWSIWTAQLSSGAGRMLWRSPSTLRGSPPGTDGGTNLHWAAGDRIVFLSYMDGWPHLYSMNASGGEPLLLTKGDYMAEHIQLSPDRRWLLFSANTGPSADDLHRRHVVRVPVDRATPEVLTPGEGVEWTPVMTGDLGSIAFIGATAQQPPMPSVRPAAGGAAVNIAAAMLPSSYPARALVTPKSVRFRASDGVEVHAQLFEPSGAAAQRRPAVVYVHGGPPRQMLLGWHYSDYYTNAYAVNQYLASRGYVVLSVNYRLGIGYGYEFHRPPNAGAQGAAEYLDIKAAGNYLRTLSGVDPARIGIYGGSYGGFLTALALGRDSDLFAAGVDIHGVHDFTAGTSGAGAAFAAAAGPAGRFAPPDRERALEVAWESSPVSAVDTWKSPVLLIHGDDDRNVRFSQTVDLVQRLAARGVDYEELVIPDDTHHWMRFTNVLRVDSATVEFFERKLKRRGVAQ